MTQQELDRLKVAAEKMGRWAVYLLSETEYWTPEALEQLTEEKLQEFQTRQAQWLMENEKNYSDSGAAEALREEITEMVKQNDRCLNEDNASEIEMMRMDEVPLPELLTKAKELLDQQQEAVSSWYTVKPDEEDEEEM
jgi:hypothetical protein